MASDNRAQLIGVSVQGTSSRRSTRRCPPRPYMIGARRPARCFCRLRAGSSTTCASATAPSAGWPTWSSRASAIRASAGRPQPGAERPGLHRQRGDRRVGARRWSARDGDRQERPFRRSRDRRLRARRSWSKLAVEDKMLVRAYGRGLALSDFPDIQLKSLSPRLLDALGTEVVRTGTVCGCRSRPRCRPSWWAPAPACRRRAAACRSRPTTAESLSRARPRRLRLGDVVAIRDYDTRWGPGYVEGAVDRHRGARRQPAGRPRPGVTIVMTCVAGRIEPEVVAERNIADLLGLRPSGASRRLSMGLSREGRVVTGAGTGLGRAVALGSGRGGRAASVARLAAYAEELDEVRAAAAARGSRSLIVPADVGDEVADTEVVAERYSSASGRSTCSSNNAGIIIVKPIEETSPGGVGPDPPHQSARALPLLPRLRARHEGTRERRHHQRHVAERRPRGLSASRRTARRSSASRDSRRRWRSNWRRATSVWSRVHPGAGDAHADVDDDVRRGRPDALARPGRACSGFVRLGGEPRTTPSPAGGTTPGQWPRGRHGSSE